MESLKTKKKSQAHEYREQRFSGWSLPEAGDGEVKWVKVVKSYKLPIIKKQITGMYCTAW